MDNPEEDFQKSATDQYFWIKLFLIFLYSFGNLDLIKVGKVQTRLLAYPVFAFGPRTNPCHRIWLPFTVKLFPILTTSYPYQIIPNLSRASNQDILWHSLNICMCPNTFISGLCQVFALLFLDQGDAKYLPYYIRSAPCRLHWES